MKDWISVSNGLPALRSNMDAFPFFMSRSLSAMVPGTRLVIVGDANQLPSIGAGNVLKDMIASGQFKVVDSNIAA